MMQIAARILSLVFHPLLMLTYMLLVLMAVNPYLFGISGLGDETSRYLLLQVFLSTFFIPVFAIVMLRLLGLVKTMDLSERTERIGPYIITGIFYLWLFRNIVGNSLVPEAYSVFMLGVTISLFLAFLINIFSRISAHTVGMGSLVGMVVICMLFFSYGTFSLTLGGSAREFTVMGLLMMVIFFAGLVGTARMVIQKPEPIDLYGGYLVGFAPQVFALQILM